MRIVYKKRSDDPTSNPKKKDVDTLTIPRMFHKTGEGRGSRFYPRNDIELLRYCKKMGFDKSTQLEPTVTKQDIDLEYLLRRSVNNLYKKQCFDKSTQLEIYHVGVKADNVTVEECLKLLRGIDCESGFIACSVEKPSLFFAELNEDDATRLKALGGIRCFCPRRRHLFTKH